MVNNRGGHLMPQGNSIYSRDTYSRNEKSLMEYSQDRGFAAPGPTYPLIDVALREFAHIPVTEFVIAARLENGDEKTYTSPSLKPYRSKIFTDQFRKNFSHYSRRAIDDKAYSTNTAYTQDGMYNDFDIDTKHGSNAGDSSSSDVNRLHYRGRQSRSEESSEDMTGCKRKRPHFSTNDMPIAVPTQKFEPLVIGNTKKVEDYYAVRFKDMQQSACKVMGKAFVKLVEPKKQTHHPYTKGDCKAPPWWPETSGENGVRHKEPDHLYKPERIRLLVHILRMIIEPSSTQCDTVQKLELNVKKLEEVTMEAMSNWFNDKEHPDNSSKRNLLREVFQVARMEERYRNGEIDGDAEYQVMTGERGVGEDTDAEDDAFKEEDEQDTIVPTNNANTPELVSPSMMSTHRQFEPEQQSLMHRSHPGMIRTHTEPQHMEDNYAEQSYSRSLSFQNVHSPSIQDPYRPGRGYVSNVSPGFQSPQQTMYQAPWPNSNIGISTNFCATTSPASVLPPATAFQLPAPQTPHMMVPRMHQPFELPHQRYDTGPALGSQLRTGSIGHPHHMQHAPTGQYHDFIQDPNPYHQTHESNVKEEQQLRTA